MDIEQEFFKTFEIKPRIFKGEIYFTSDYRYAQHEAEEDIWWDINSDKILEIESILGDFQVLHDKDENLYEYSFRGHKTDKGYPTRKEALLRILIKYKDEFYDRIKSLFTREY